MTSGHGQTRENFSLWRGIVLGLFIVAVGWPLTLPSAYAALPAGSRIFSAAPWRQAGLRVEEVRPAIYYLPDKQGRLQAVLDFQYEDFVELYRQMHRLETRPEPPPYSLQQLFITGTVQENYATLEVRLQAATNRNDWVRIPLRLDQGLLLEAALGKESRRFIIAHEGNGVGYVCWIHGENAGLHEINLKLLLPLDTAAEENRLRIFLPRAAESRMELAVPTADAMVAVSGGALLSTSPSAAKGTIFTVVGLESDFQLGWHGPDAEVPIALEASATVLVRLVGRSILSDAALSVRSQGAAFERFTVRLPPMSELREQPATNYVLTPLPEPEVTTAESRATQGRLVEVRLKKKTVGPVEVRLACRREGDFSAEGQWCELAGFEVPEALRQWGTIGVFAGESWQVLWGPRRDVQELNPPPENLAGKDLAAAFEYDSQPYSLCARWAPRQTRLSVEPHFLLCVEQGRLRVEGKLKYVIQGAKSATLELDPAGWEISSIGPDALLAQDGIVVAESGNVLIPLRQPTVGSLELHFKGRRTLKPEADSFVVALPRPRADMLEAGSLAVASAENLALTPDLSQCQGLLRQSGGEDWGLTGTLRPTLYYRLKTEQPLFAAAVRVLELQEMKAAEPMAIMDRAWLQTRLTKTSREDRLVLQLSVSPEWLEASLPEGALLEEAVVFVNGRQVAPRRMSADRFSIPLPSRTETQPPTLLELRYHFREYPSAEGRLRLAFPRFNPKLWLRQAYWQLVLPADVHLLTAPAGWNGEYAWHWSGVGWRRSPLWEQATLETWLSAAHEPPISDANYYLFSSFGELGSVRFRTISRSRLVLMASGVALLIGLVLIHFPRVRCWAAPTIGGAVAIAAVIAPDLTLLLLQAAMIGLALAVSTGVVEGVLARRKSHTLPGAASRQVIMSQDSFPAANADCSATILLPQEQLPKPDERP